MEDEAEEIEHAEKLGRGKKKALKAAAEKKSLLQDDRFKALFENPEFELNPDNEDTEALNPVMSQLNRLKNKVSKQKAEELDRQREQERLEFESKFEHEVRP